MATFVLLHGAGSDSFYWHLVVPELEQRGHEVIAPDLRVDDGSAGFADYTDVAVDAIGDRPGVVLVAQSLAGFTAPLVCERVPVDLMILVAAMIPAPGESAGEWWDDVGFAHARSEQARRDGRPNTDFDMVYDFFHDVPPDVTAEVMARGESTQSAAPFEQPWPLAVWPDVPTKFLLCRDDHFFPADFMRRVVRERLGITPDEIDSGHLPALAHPKELAARLDAYSAL
jgi:pimeloyl-ACP methyl ester carboxylesterase